MLHGHTNRGSVMVGHANTWQNRGKYIGNSNDMSAKYHVWQETRHGLAIEMSMLPCLRV